MNIEDYISSGILECYVLGQLSRTEAAKVEELASAHPEIRKEILAIEEGLEQYALANAMEPAPGVKERLMKEIDQRSLSSPEENITDKVLEIYRPNKAINYLAAASVIFALLFGSAALFYSKQLEEAKYEIASLRLANERTAANFQVKDKAYKTELQNRDHLLSILRDTSTTAVQLKGLPLSPVSVAMVFWNKKEQTVFIDVKSLPIPPTDKQYQLWALDNGIPIDAGVFEQAFAGLQKMKNVESAQAFAVTLENKGGSSSPTLENMYVMGPISHL